MGTNLPAEPMEPALGSHTTARRAQSREIINTWGLLSPTNRASWRPPLVAPKGRNSISQGQSHSTCAKADTGPARSAQAAAPKDVGAQPQSPSGVAGGVLSPSLPPSYRATKPQVTLSHRSLTVTNCSGTTAGPVSQANLRDTSCN